MQRKLEMDSEYEDLRYNETTAEERRLREVVPRLEDVDEKGKTWLREGRLVIFHDHPIRNASKVFYGERISPPDGRSQRVAVKLMPKRNQSVDKWKSLQRFRHKSLLRILDCGECYVMGRKIFVVMELCRKDMTQYIEDDMKKPVKFNYFLNFFNQLLDVMDYIQQKDLVHQNLNPDNILIGGDGKIRLCGFQFTEEADKSLTNQHADGFWSPEMYQRGAKPTYASDVFQLGLVTAYFVSGGLHPFGSDPYEWSYNIKCNKNLDLSIVPEFADQNSDKRYELVALLKTMLNQDPKARPSIKAITKNPFFQVNGEKIPRNLRQQTSGKVRPPYVAQHDFDAVEEDDLSFKAGDRLIILDDTEGDWWKARLIKTSKEGYIPYNYVRPAYKGYFEEWYFGSTSRKESEKLLLHENNVRGTFLIRENENKAGHVLSVLDRDNSRKPMVRHYRILKPKENIFSLGQTVQCKSLQELIQYYTDIADGLCCRLTKPCPRDGESDELQIPRDHIKLREVIGTGQFGQVHKGLWNGKSVAIKKYKKDTMSPEEFLIETHMMRLMRHERLVKLYGVVYADPILMVTEWMCHGSLRDYLIKGDGSKYDLLTLLPMGAQVAEGMRFMESKNFIHRDLRADNILVGEGNNCKIGDFGLARLIQDEIYESKEGTKLPTRWMPPEAIINARFTTKSDVWSFGILLTEIVSKGQVPYEGLRNFQVGAQVAKGGRVPQHRDCPDALYALMLECWRDDPSERPDFKYLQNALEIFFTTPRSLYRKP